jgi:hypothetical protein
MFVIHDEAAILANKQHYWPLFLQLGDKCPETTRDFIYKLYDESQKAKTVCGMDLERVRNELEDRLGKLEVTAAAFTEVPGKEAKKKKTQ